jgi:uncharacterized protein
MKSIVLFFWLIMIQVFVGGLGPEQALAASDLIPFYTPAAGGTAYVLGAGAVAVSNKYMKESTLVAEACAGTLDIMRRMMQREAGKKACFGLFGTPDAWAAYNGRNEYAVNRFASLRGVVFTNASDHYLVVPAGSPIKTYQDVKGRRIGVGGAGSTSANTFLFLLAQHGISKKDFKPFYFTHKEIVEGITDGSLDGGVVGGGYPVPAYTEMSTTHDVRIVPVDEAVLSKVSSEYPYYYKSTVKAKSYRGIDRDVPTWGFTVAIFTHSGVNDALVYKFIKNLFDHRSDYYAIHASAKDMTHETATRGIPIPLHAGAEQYLREVGAIK